VPVSDLHASTEWYRRFFGREPDLVAGDEVLWDVRPGATLFIDPNPAAAGSGHVTFAVTGLDELLERLHAAGIQHEPIETYDNGVRHDLHGRHDHHDRLHVHHRGLFRSHDRVRVYRRVQVWVR
jgi:hypothetical protein